LLFYKLFFSPIFNKHLCFIAGAKVPLFLAFPNISKPFFAFFIPFYLTH